MEESAKQTDDDGQIPKRIGLQAANQWKRAALMTRALTAFRETIEDDSEDEVDTKQQIKYGSNYEATKAIFSEYCDNSTIHGFKYLGEKKRPFLERFFWISVLLFSIYTCVQLTLNIWDKWNNNPVIVSFAEKSTPVWQIPFPSITICPEMKSRQTIFNFTHTFWKVTDQVANLSTAEPLTAEENFFMEAISQICDSHLQVGLNFGESHVKVIDLIKAMETVKPSFEDTFSDCNWRNSPIQCQRMLSKFLSEDGICYSFNSLSGTEIYSENGFLPELVLDGENRTSTGWNVENGYSESADMETYPHRVLGPGSRAGLFMVLKGLEEDFDNLCRGPTQGFKLILTTPGEIPQVAKQYFRIPFDQEVLISIKPKIITTSEGLRHYEPHRRQCYFQNERDLRYFNIYTQSNCELECLANFTYTKCGCVKFSMPRHAEIPICGASKVLCFNEAEDELLMKEFNQGLVTTQLNVRGRTECDCLPACTSIAYEAEISQADFDINLIQNNIYDSNAKKKIIEQKLSRISIFFKEAQFLSSKRSELYGTTDFLANCGGLLGLFMGVSTLSIVEIVYFCTVRLITNLKMRHEKRKDKKMKQIDDKEA